MTFTTMKQIKEKNPVIMGKQRKRPHSFQLSCIDLINRHLDNGTRIFSAVLFNVSNTLSD